MTCREKLALERPELVSFQYDGGCYGCPDDYGYLPDPEHCEGYSAYPDKCTKCWDREIPEESPSRDCYEAGIAIGEAICKGIEDGLNNPHILDSGERREFESGAVRDIQEGKGRCDLMPLEVVASLFPCLDKGLESDHDLILDKIAEFQRNNDTSCLLFALSRFAARAYNYDGCTMILEVSKHFEEGAKKYGEHNWQKGIPVHCYIDSAVRHYLKFLRGDKDEPHDRAFVWNIMCCIWTCKHKPELNCYARTPDPEAK